MFGATDDPAAQATATTIAVQEPDLRRRIGFVYGLLVQIENLLAHDDTRRCEIVRIKESFAGLWTLKASHEKNTSAPGRLDPSASDPTRMRPPSGLLRRIGLRVWQAENAALRICERCGAGDGLLHLDRRVTLCPECAELFDRGLPMTMPNERMRALRWGLELLQLMAEDATLPSFLSSRVGPLLLDYPEIAGLKARIADGRSSLQPEWTHALRDAEALFIETEISLHGSVEVQRHLRYVRRHFPDRSMIISMSRTPLSYWLESEDCMDGTT